MKSKKSIKWSVVAIAVALLSILSVAVIILTKKSDQLTKAVVTYKIRELTPKIYMLEGVDKLTPINEYVRKEENAINTWSLFIAYGSDFKDRKVERWTPYLLGTKVQGDSWAIRLRASRPGHTWDQCQTWDVNHKGYVFVFSENDYGNCK